MREGWVILLHQRKLALRGLTARTPTALETQRGLGKAFIYTLLPERSLLEKRLCIWCGPPRAL